MAGQEAITAQYDRVAPWYRALSPLFLINPLMRRKAVAAMALRPGDAVLEVGVGSGRNLPYLLDAVGPGGSVTGVDLSPGMLTGARKLGDRRGATNVDLIETNAATVEYDRDFDAVLFSLSYSAMPADVRPPALDRAWDCLRPGGRLVILDGGIARTRLRPVIAPIARQLVKLGPGDPDVNPLDDLAHLGEVVSEPALLDVYFVYTVVKPRAGAQRSIGSP
ncbi:MAG TPA: class I SAM-dependent methyltransferase [Solirubrobacterales bacterium]|nr:class I SAM-dependent methyltransferase [Solirubrobacterales bacterium]